MASAGDLTVNIRAEVDEESFEQAQEMLESILWPDDTWLFVAVCILAWMLAGIVGYSAAAAI